MFERPQENREDEFESLPQSDALVVLSCDIEEKKNGQIVPDLESKMRTIGALELWKRGYAKKIMFSGGVAKKFPGEKSRAGAMKDYIEKYGVPEQDIMTENASQNTAENLDNVLAILEKEPEIKSILIETNEYHLERAHDLFVNILKKHNLSLEEVGFVSAEDLLSMRSPHYRSRALGAQALVPAYKFPESLKNAPKDAVKKGIREFLRRVLIYIDPNDRLARFLVHKLRAPKKEQE